eukprot:1161039-Pelagomonas_calceolata.AAC.1
MPMRGPHIIHETTLSLQSRSSVRYSTDAQNKATLSVPVGWHYMGWGVGESRGCKEAGSRGCRWAGCKEKAHRWGMGSWIPLETAIIKGRQTGLGCCN